MEHPLLLHVRLDEVHLLLAPACELEVAKRLLVHREDPDSGAILGSHVADRRPVRQGQRRDPGTVELDELADDSLLPEHLGDGEHQVRGRRALGQLSGEADPHDLRNEHRHGLPQQRGLGLDAAHSPAEHSQAVDHRGVRVGAHEGIGVGLGLAPCGREDDAREILEVHLVDDTRVGRHDTKAREGLLCPSQEGVALAVTAELEIGVHLERGRRAELVDDHRVVDYELGGEERVHAFRVAAHGPHRVAHGCEVNDGRHACEVLHQDAGRHKRDLFVRGLLGIPARQPLDLRRGYRAPVFAAQQVLEQDA